MKVRNGFVSNSSSSSFMIYGTAFPTELVNENGEDIDVMEELESIEDEINLDVHIMGIEDLVYLGKCPSKVPDDMKMGDWKEQVRNEIYKVAERLGIKEEMEIMKETITWHEECWFDG
mgnify:CR=1 FL=1